MPYQIIRVLQPRKRAENIDDVFIRHIDGAVLQDAGIRVPEQVIVSGFDGYEQIFYTTPKISSASCDSVLLAEAAGEAAMQLLRGETCPSRMIPPKLIPNESCGCPTMIWQAHTLLSSFNNSFYRHQEDVQILYAISTAMETSQTPYEMAARIHQHKTKHHLTIVDRHCFDTDQNYFLISEEEMKPRDLHLINDADYAEEHRFTHIPVPDEVWNDPTVNPKESVLSGGYRDRILEIAELGYPLIFNSLDYMNRPFGFACYYFQEPAITDYSRSASITNALNIALILGENPGINLIVTGGEFKAPTLSLTGDMAANSIANLHANKLFLATAGISADLNLTYPSLSDLVVKKTMIESADQVFLVADTSKMGNSAFATLGSISMVHHLITNDNISDEAVEKLEKMNVEVLKA